MKLWINAILTLTVIMLPGIAKSQQSQKNPPVVPASPLPTVTASYMLGPGDVLSIKVVNMPFLSMDVTVPPDGKITPAPSPTPISVVGLTTEQLVEKLTTIWEEYVHNPSVSVNITQLRPQDAISLYGYASSSGSISEKPGLKLLDVVAHFGGAGSIGDLSHLTVTHKNGTSVILDLSHPEIKGDSPDNILMQPGDIIYVPRRYEYISVLGEVQKPGSILYQDKIRVLDAIAAAGGFVEGEANLFDATITDDGKVMPINLYDLYSGGKIALNILLHPGDEIYVPRITNQVFVMGAVTNAGPYNFRPGDHLLDVINHSVPVGNVADMGRIQIIHTKQINDIRAKLAVSPKKSDQELLDPKNQNDLSKLLHKEKAIIQINFNGFTGGNLAVNVPLSPGDVIMVPYRHQGFGIQQIFQTLSGLNLLRILTGF